MSAPRELSIVQSAVQAQADTLGAVDSDGPVLAYPPEAILELPHVAAWLRVSERTVERLDIPFALLGKRTKRYLARDVIDYLSKKSVRA